MAENKQHNKNGPNKRRDIACYVKMVFIVI